MDPNRKRKQPADDSSSTDVDTGGRVRLDWRVGLDPSLRVINRAMIAWATHNNPDEMQSHTPSILKTANGFELEAYQSGISKFDYLTEINEYIQNIPFSEKDSKGLELRQKLTKQLGNLNQIGSSTIGSNQPIKNLLKTHREVINFLAPILHESYVKLAQAVKEQDFSNRMVQIPERWPQQKSTVTQNIWQETVKLHQGRACCDFSLLMTELRTILEKMVQAEEQGQNKINSDPVNYWYARTMEELIDTFSMCLNYELDKQKNQIQLIAYRDWLVKLKQSDGPVKLDLTSWVSYSKQSQYLGLRPDPIPIDLTQTGYLEPHYLGGESQNVGISSVPIESSSQHSKPKHQREGHLEAGPSCLNEDESGSIAEDTQNF